MPGSVLLSGCVLLAVALATTSLIISATHSSGNDAHKKHHSHDDDDSHVEESSSDISEVEAALGALREAAAQSRAELEEEIRALRLDHGNGRIDADALKKALKSLRDRGDDLEEQIRALNAAATAGAEDDSSDDDDDGFGGTCSVPEAYQRVLVEDVTVTNVTKRLLARDPRISLTNSPADPSAAVGLDRIATVQNSLVRFLDKATHVPLWSAFIGDFFQYPFFQTKTVFCPDPISYFDHETSRFFIGMPCAHGFLNNALINIHNGSNAGIVIEDARAGTNYVALPTWSVTGVVVPTVPADACSALSNAAALAGKIALIQANNFVCSSTAKANRARLAGAVGYIIYNNVAPGAVSVGIAGVTQIPGVYVTGDAGALLLNSPNVTISKPSTAPAPYPTRFGTISLAVSKTAYPAGINDFRFYTIGNNATTSPLWHRNTLALFLSANAKTFYLSMIADSLGQLDELGDAILGISKSQLIDGTISSSILSAQLAFESAITYANDTNVYATSHWYNTPPGSVQRLAANEKKYDPVSYFVRNSKTPSGTDGLYTYTIDRLRTLPTGVVQTASFEVDVPPGVVTSGEPYISQGVFNVPEFNDTVAIIPRFTWIPTKCVLQRSSLWCASQIPRGTRWYVDWFEFDVSEENSISIRQTGTIPTTGEDMFTYPAIDINECGEVTVSGSMIGPGRYQTIQHYGRVPSDPLNTMPAIRTLSTFQALNPYLAVNFGGYPGNSTIAISRVNDITTLDLDPTDDRTFFYYSECFIEPVDTVVNFQAPAGWHTCLIKYHFETVPGTLAARHANGLLAETAAFHSATVLHQSSGTRSEVVVTPSSSYTRGVEGVNN